MRVEGDVYVPVLSPAAAAVHWRNNFRGQAVVVVVVAPP